MQCRCAKKEIEEHRSSFIQGQELYAQVLLRDEVSSYNTDRTGEEVAERNCPGVEREIGVNSHVSDLAERFVRQSNPKSEDALAVIVFLEVGLNNAADIGIAETQFHRGGRRAGSEEQKQA